MSRNIKQNNSSFDASAYTANHGKLVITEYQGMLLAMYMKENRMLAVGRLTTFDQEKDHIGDIYIGRVSKVIKNNETCFVEYKKGVNGFLPMKDLGNHMVREGDLLPVMIAREAIKTKLATLTTHYSYTGTYFVFVHEAEVSIGVSQKISKNAKEQIRCFLQEYHKPDCSIVARTEVAKLSEEELQGVYEEESAVYHEIERKITHGSAFSTIYLNTSLENELFSLFKREECLDVITDSLKVYQGLNEASGAFWKEQAKISFYDDNDFSLEKLYRIPSGLQEALQEKVWLKSGANLIIEQMESLTAIDINSGKGTLAKGKSAEEAKMQINLEAAREIALQLRLRNIAGMVIVDFINVENPDHEKELLDYMKKCTADDIQAVTVVDFTKLGLMEITRKKGKKSLREQLRGEEHETSEV